MSLKTKLYYFKEIQSLLNVFVVKIYFFKHFFSNSSEVPRNASLPRQALKRYQMIKPEENARSLVKKMKHLPHRSVIRMSSIEWIAVFCASILALILVCALMKTLRFRSLWTYMCLRMRITTTRTSDWCYERIPMVRFTQTPTES